MPMCLFGGGFGGYARRRGKRYTERGMSIRNLTLHSFEIMSGGIREEVGRGGWGDMKRRWPEGGRG